MTSYTRVVNWTLTLRYVPTLLLVTGLSIHASERNIQVFKLHSDYLIYRVKAVRTFRNSTVKHKLNYLRVSEKKTCIIC